MKYWFLTLYVSIICCSCNEKEHALNKFDDPIVLAIAELQDRRSGDSLLVYLKHSNPLYRQAAALAYGSIQDSNYVESLQDLLFADRDTMVRRAAAYAIGQTQSLRSEQVLHGAAATEKNRRVLAEIIQAYGKVAREWNLNITPDDTATTVALAWSFYRMAVRGVSDGDLNSRSVEFLKSGDSKTRLGAAHYFARGAQDFERFESVLSHVALRDESAEVRMAAALALGKIKSDSSLRTTLAVARNDPDDRVRTNAIRSLQNYQLYQTKKLLIVALRDKSVNVAIASSETIKATITKQNWQEFYLLAQTTTNWRVQANLYEAVLSSSTQEDVLNEVKSLYNISTNTYQKAALLSALHHAQKSYDFVHKQLLERDEPVIKSSAASALVAMNYHKNFDSSLAGLYANMYQQAIQNGDAAVIGIIASALADSTLNYKSTIKDFNFLKVARGKLTLPKDYESVVPLEAAIAYFEGRKLNSSIANSFNHPIDWDVVKKIPPDQRAIINTSKGIISIRLLIEETPGSVVNFILLASRKYYDGKFIHRVVPNFVVQDGCPRGDGWGSEAYSIRSEFSPHRYWTGSMGMASAGKDTEGTQWFITHSPTPHLEGRYTLFADVESGMDVVQTLEVGDKINSVEIINFTPL